MIHWIKHKACICISWIIERILINKPSVFTYECLLASIPFATDVWDDYRFNSYDIVILYFTGKSIAVASDQNETNLFNIPIDPLGKSEMLSFMRSQRGAPFLVHAGFIYRCERFNGQRTYWLCTKYKTVKCNGRLICQANEIVKSTQHSHERDLARMDRTVIEYHNMTDPNVEEFLSSYKK